ncbi:MAG: hypothetical protein P8181_06130 [bacterium]
MIEPTMISVSDPPFLSRTANCPGCPELFFTVVDLWTVMLGSASTSSISFWIPVSSKSLYGGFFGNAFLYFAAQPPSRSVFSTSVTL